MVVLTGEYDLQKLLQLHAGIVAGHKRLNDNRRSQIALEQIGKTVDGGLAVPIRSALRTQSPGMRRPNRRIEPFERRRASSSSGTRAASSM